MICVFGKSASGKDTLVNRLVSEHGFEKIITYTTRPMRDGENQDKTYHFIDEKTFENMIDLDEFAEWRTYNTVFGKWYYGVAVCDIKNADDNHLLIITPDGYYNIIEAMGCRPKSVYIYADDDTLNRRLALRGGDPEENERRLLYDDFDFLDFEQIADKVIRNEDGHFDETVSEFLGFAEGE